MTKQKTILITGASSGFGKDTAIALSQRGHNVIATAHTEALAQELTRFVKENHLDIETFKLDVTSEKDRRKALDYSLDILINNAGMGESGSLAEISLDKVRSNFETNLFGPLALSQLVLKKMFKQNHGTIIFISSLAGRITMPFLGAYSMTKFALSAGAEALRSEIGRINKKINIVVVEPGAYHTGFNQKNIAKKFEWMGKNSYFYKIIDQIKQEEEKYFALSELKSNNTIVNKIVTACEAEKPRFRYTAPWWQSMAVQLMRVFGR